MKAALKAWHFAALATVAAFGLALYQLGHESFWVDEFTFWEFVHLPFEEIWAETAREFHPPLHSWLIYGWLRIAPAADEFWLRLPHAIFFALTVPVMYRLGRMLGGTPRAGVYAALLAATFPFLFRYGQWARPYALLTFFAACGFAAVAHLAFRYRDETAAPRLLGAGLVEAARLVVRGEWRVSGLRGGRSCAPHTPDLCEGRSCAPHTPGWRAAGDDIAWMVYIVSASAVMWLHNTAAIFPVVTGLIFLCAIWAVPSHRGLRFINLCIATGLIALLYAPHAAHIVSQTMSIDLGYVQDVRVVLLLKIFQEIYGRGYLPLVLLALFLIAMIPWARQGQWERLAFACLGWLVAPTVLILFSLWKPILQPKLLVWPLVPFLATVAAGLAWLPWSFVRVVLLAVLVAWNLEGVTREWEKMKHDARGVIQTFAKEASSDATVILCPPWYLDLFRYYLKVYGVEDVFTYSHYSGNRREVARLTPDGRRGGRVDARELFTEYREVWVACENRFNFLAEALEEEGQLIKQWKFKGKQHLGLSLYERRE